MKALVILNTILEDEEWEGMKCVASDFKRSYVEKAIAELEALQAPKTCGTCKQKYHDGFCDIVFNAQLFDNTDETVAVYIEAMDGFSCAYYEPKDNA